MWPFKKKPQQPKLIDKRCWNEDWRVGDIAECVIDFDDWHPAMMPWNRPPRGTRLTVTGFSEGTGHNDNALHYFLRFEEWPIGLSTVAFRKVRPVSNEEETREENVIDKILKAAPGKDRVREEV